MEAAVRGEPTLFIDHTRTVCIVQVVGHVQMRHMSHDAVFRAALRLVRARSVSAADLAFVRASGARPLVTLARLSDEELVGAHLQPFLPPSLRATKARVTHTLVARLASVYSRSTQPHRVRFHALAILMTPVRRDEINALHALHAMPFKL